MNLTNLSEMIEDIPENLAPSLTASRIVGNHLFLDVQVEALSGFVTHISKKYHTWLVSMHATDERNVDGTYHIHTVFALPKGDEYVTLVAAIDPTSCSYDSIVSSVYAAERFEREIQDMFGLVPHGHPDPRPLVLYDDWPVGEHPLRKDFALRSRPARVPERYHFKKVEGDGIFEIPVGPVHAGVIEPGHFRFSVAGEPIVNLETRFGYTHRGVEKLSESLPYERGVLLAERISGDNGFAHSLAYCQALESASGAEVPERACLLRSAYAEMERIYNLCGDIGGISLDTAFTVGAQSAYICRENVMALNELVTGSRLLRGINVIGGVRRDIDHAMVQKIESVLVGVKLDISDLAETMTSMPSLLDRIETTGVLTYDTARNLDVVGPVARASGIDRDVRRDHPYAAYRELSFSVPLYREGDVLARLRVKVEEVYESISIIEQALDKLPAGDLSCIESYPEEGSIGMSLVESPRGELMHWLQCGIKAPSRHKVRDASFLNWPAIEHAVMGNIVPDFPLINKSFNLSYSGNDL